MRPNLPLAFLMNWTEKDILRFINLPAQKTFPAWEILLASTERRAHVAISRGVTCSVRLGPVYAGIVHGLTWKCQ